MSLDVVASPPDIAAASAPAHVTRREVDLVYSAALRRCGDVHLAEDVTQAVFVVLARRRDAAARSAGKTGSLAGWLLMTTRHVTANALRRQRRRDYHERRAAMHPVLPPPAAIASGDPSVALAWRELAPLIDDAVLSLGQGDRTALLLRFYEDRSSADIAAALGCSPEAARQRVSRALEKLRKKLAHRGVALPAATLAATLSSQAVTAAPITLSQTCLALATGATAPAAVASLATGGTMLTPLALKTAVVIGLTATVAGIGIGIGLAGSGGQIPTAVGVVTAGTGRTTTPATQPTTQPTTQSALAAATAIDAANLPPSDEVIERVLVPSEKGKFEIDLDTGRIYEPADYADDHQVFAEGVDAVLSRSPLTPGIRGFGMVVKPVVDSAWELEPAAPVLGELWERDPAYGEGEFMDAIGELPRTYLFRTEEGAGGVLQIIERLENAEGEAPGIRLRYKVLVRGEGRSLVEYVMEMEEHAKKVEGDMAGRGGWTEEEMQLGGRIRRVLQLMLLYTVDIDHQGQWPPSLDAAHDYAAEEGHDWPEGLPETLVYVPPTRNPEFPQSMRPVLFEDVRLPEPTPQNPQPSIAVGMEDGSVFPVREQEELNKRLRRAGLPVPEGAQDEGNEVGAEGEASIRILSPEGQILGEHETVQAAIDAAPEGGTVRLPAGRFEEKLAIRKPITLEGAGWDRTTIFAAPPDPAEIEAVARRLIEELDQGGVGVERQAVIHALRERILAPVVKVTGAPGGVTFRDVTIASEPTPAPDGSSLRGFVVVRIDGSSVRFEGAAIVGSPGNGIEAGGGSNLELTNSLVAGTWMNGINFFSRDAVPGMRPRLSVTDSDIRNCYHYGIHVGGDVDATIERNRIGGTAWHGLRYDHAAPVVRHNRIYDNARSGIYASGTTAGKVEGNVFARNEMNGISMWFNAGDTLVNNRFEDNAREAIAVLGDSRPTLRDNVIIGSPIGVLCSAIGGGNPQPPASRAVGQPTLESNIFWNNEVHLARSNEEGPVPLDLPEGNVVREPRDEDGPAGVAEAQSPFPLLPEEKAIIPTGESRDHRAWQHGS